MSITEAEIKKLSEADMQNIAQDFCREVLESVKKPDSIVNLVSNETPKPEEPKIKYFGVII